MPWMEPAGPAGAGEERKTGIDGGGVERGDGFVEIDAESVIGVPASGDVDQRLDEIGMDAPVAFLVGIGERAAGYIAPDAHEVELGVLGAQTGHNAGRYEGEGG